MTRRPTTEADRAALKAAFRRLIRDAGGQAEAAKATRVDQQRLSSYGAPHQDGSHAPADVIADLTIDTDNADMVRVLCGLAGGVFVPLPPTGSGGVWAAELANAVREGGEAASVICTALADGGRVSAREVRDLNIIAEVSEAIEALAVLKRHCEAVLAGECK